VTVPLQARGWPFGVWTAPAAYDPFLFAAVPTARRRLVALVSDPTRRLVRAATRHLVVRDRKRRPPGRDATREAVAELARRANASGVSRHRLAEALRLRGVLLDAQSLSIVGGALGRDVDLVHRFDQCFAHRLEQRLAALASGAWLPFVAERFDESLLVVAKAYDWSPDRLLPAPPARDQLVQSYYLDPPVERILRDLQPHDATLYAVAENALSAWVSKIPDFGKELSRLRAARRAWTASCAAEEEKEEEASSRRSSPGSKTAPSDGDAATTRVVEPNRADPHHLLVVPERPPDTCRWLRSFTTKSRRRVDPNDGDDVFRPYEPPACVPSALWSTWCAAAEVAGLG